MTAAEARHAAAAVAFMKAKQVLESHDGKLDSPEFAAKVRDWRMAMLAHASAGLEVAKEQLEHLEREEAHAALQADVRDRTG